MKCKQRACNRNKKLLNNGFCNVCNKAIMDINAENNAQKKVNEAIIMDLINVNEKLRQGEIVDQNVVNGLIMGGIISLITKKAELDEDLEARITQLEVDEKTSKSRIESLESWIQKHDEKLKEISAKGEKNHENIEMLKRKLVSLEGMPKQDKDEARIVIEKKCKHCEETFSRNCDLEKHMDEHENGKGFKCNTSEKTFHLKWRLNKHEKNHNENGVKHCRYFSHQEPCPCEAIGCKSLHVRSEICSFDDCQDLLCPLTHQNLRNDDEVANVEMCC